MIDLLFKKIEEYETNNMDDQYSVFHSLSSPSQSLLNAKCKAHHHSVPC